MFIPGLRPLLLVVALVSPLSAQATLYFFYADLDAAQEAQVPAVDSPGVGKAILTFDDVTNSFDLTLAGVGLTSPVRAAHFHLGVPGTNGPIVQDLGRPGSFQQGSGSYAFNALYFNAGASDDFHLADLLAGRIYVNVHTTLYQMGEIRGQMRQLVPIPEPQTWALTAAGLLALAGSALRRHLAA